MATYDVKQIALPGGDIVNLKDGNAIHKSNTSGFVKNDGSIDQNTYQIAQEGKGLSTNDFTNEDKALIGQTLGNNTVLTTDKTPFLTRQTLNPTGFSGYVREKLVGASYAWNQLVQNGNFADTSNWQSSGVSSFTVSGNVATFTPSERYGNISNTLAVYDNHKYLAMVEVKLASNPSGQDVYGDVRFNEGAKRFGTCTATTNWQTLAGIIYGQARSNGYIRIIDGSTSNWVQIQVRNARLIDLTLAFGSTIADYLYGLSNNGGITKLRDMGCPIDKYTPYGYGLYSVKTSEKRVKADIDLPLKNQTRSQTGAISDINIRAISTYYDLKKGSLYRIMPSTSESGKTLRMSWQYWSNKSEGSNARLYDTGWITTFPVLITPEEDSIWTCVLSYSDESNVNISKVNVSASFAEVDYSLGNDELRGKFDLVDGEIVASGDIKESNGNTQRNWVRLHLGDYTYTRTNIYTGIYGFMPSISNINIKTGSDGVCSKYVYGNFPYVISNDKSFWVHDRNANTIYIRDDSYTDETAFKTAMNGVYMDVELATPTTEQSTPFADPMSLVGATTEEYIDTRDIPCPVGAERQYMGQSEDIIPIPSAPQSDGVRYLKSYKSGNQEQLVWEGEGIAPVRKDSINIKGYTTENNAFTCPCDGYIFVRLPSGSGHVLMRLMDSLGNVVGTYIDAADAEEEKAYSVFVKRGIKTYAYCYVGETLEYTYWFYGIT